MDQAELNHLREQIEHLARNRFPGPAGPRVVLRQYGDEPTIEPGELLVRLVIEPPDDRRHFQVRDWRLLPTTRRSPHTAIRQ